MYALRTFESDGGPFLRDMGAEKLPQKSIFSRNHSHQVDFRIGRSCGRGSGSRRNLQGQGNGDAGWSRHRGRVANERLHVHVHLYRQVVVISRGAESVHFHVLE